LNALDLTYLTFVYGWRIQLASDYKDKLGVDGDATTKLISCKNGLHQKHIYGSSTRDGQQHVSSPKMEKNAAEDTYEFWQTVTASEKLHILQAINHQHSKDGTRQITPEETDKAWRMILGRKQQERQKPCADD
jgi:hypothetical protein